MVRRPLVLNAQILIVYVEIKKKFFTDRGTANAREDIRNGKAGVTKTKANKPTDESLPTDESHPAP